MKRHSKLLMAALGGVDYDDVEELSGELLAELDEAQDLGGRDVHGVGGRAARGAAEAVETALHILLAQLAHLLGKAQVRLHPYLP